MLRACGHSGRLESRQPVSPWLIGIKAFVFGAAWFELIALVFVPRAGLAVWIPLTAGPVWAIMSFSLVRYWSAPRGWSDIHRWALCFGAVFGCMAISDISAVGWTRLDLIAKFVFQFLGSLGFCSGSVRTNLAARRPAPDRSTGWHTS